MKGGGCASAGRLLLSSMLLATGVPAVPAAADEEAPVEQYRSGEVTVTATRREQEIFDTPVPTTVVTREEIMRRNPVDVGDLLEDVAGLDVADDGAFRGRPVIRGLDSNRVLILIDGVRVSNPRVLTGFGGVQPTVDPQDLERVEVVRGPASVLYGSDALGGVVNLVTRKPEPSEELTATPMLRFAYGSAGNRREALAGIEAAQGAWAGSLRATGREIDDYHAPSGRVPNSDARSASIAPRLRWQPLPEWTATLDGEIFRAADVGVPIEEESRDSFTAEFPRDDRDRAVLRLTHAPSAAQFLGEASGTVYYQRQRRRFTFTVDVEDDGGTPNDPNDDTDVFVFQDTTSSIDTVGATLLSQWNLPGGVPGVSAQILTAGLDYFEDSISDDAFSRSDVFVGPGVIVDGTAPDFDAPVPIPGGPGLVDEESESREPSVPDAVQRNLAAYVQDELLLPLQSSLFVGGRADAIFFDADRRPGDDFPASETTIAATGAAGVVVPVRPWLHAVVNVARGFRAPNLGERFFSGPGSVGGVIVPNPSLEPETSFNVDAGVKVEHRRVRGSLTGFRSDIRNLIRTVPTGEEETFTFENVDDVVLMGVEAQATVALRPSLTLGANLAFTDEDADVEDEAAFPTAAPPLNGVVVLRYEPPRILGPDLCLDLPYVEGRVRLVDDFEDLTGEERDGYVTASLRTGARVAEARWGSLRVDLGLENLANATYVPTFGTVDAAGRTVTAAMSWRF